MQDQIAAFLGTVNGIVWGPPMLILLVGTGVFLTIRLGGLQFRALGHALWLAFIKRSDPGAEGDISHFQALMTALSATVGTGNIAGVATAIGLGGPGALFWMWVTGLFGMATKYAEALLAVKTRERDAAGTMSGGPMHYLRSAKSLGAAGPILGTAFAVCAAIAAFGIGNLVQSNSVAAALERSFSIPPLVTGLLLAFSTGAVILGGIQAIGRVTSVLVPVMIVIYMGGAITVIAYHAEQIPEAFRLVFSGAFGGTAAAGGFAGAAVAQAVRFGVARGVFSNESGLGSSAMAAAAAQTNDPVRQALVSMTQTFIDTIIVCTLTGLAIITSGAWSGDVAGAPMASAAFESAMGESGGAIVAIGLALFAYSTLLGWSYYGEKCAAFLWGEGIVKPYRAAFVVVIVPGALFELDLVWAFADAMNALMAIPNLIGLIALSGVITAESKRYFAEHR